MGSKYLKYSIIFFLISILITAPSTVSTPVNAASPNNLNSNDNVKNNGSSQNNSNSNNDSPGQIKKILDQYPNTTPMQEKIKKAINIMKNGDPKKPKDNNGKKNLKNIPDFTSEVLSVEEIIKNGKVVGKTIKTKSTLIFKNKGQTGQSDDQWNRLGFDKNLIGELDDSTFKEMCKQAKGKISKDGQFCDVKETVKGDINSKLAKLNNKWMSDDFYLLEGGDLETAKEEAKQRGVFPPSMKNNNEKEFGHKNNDFFKNDSNPNGLGIDSHQKKFEFVEEYTLDFSEALENIPDDADLSNFPIISSSYSFTNEEEQKWQNYLPKDLSELILPKAEAQAPTETISQFAMMGFTLAPPKLSYSIQFSESICFPVWYPTKLHIKFSHFHVHFGHQTICTELFFFKLFANAEIGAGFRLPIEVVFENVPKAAFDGEEFTINAFIKPKDFTVPEYIDFCESTNIKNDFFLKLSKALGQDPCERFAFENFFFADSSVAGTGIGSLDPGHLINTGTGEIIPKDGDEFVIKFKLGAGVSLKLINRTIDVCSILVATNVIGGCVLGYNVDVGVLCTTTNMTNLDFDDRIKLAFFDYPDDFTKNLKDLNLNCSSFATPVGVGTTLFGITMGVPADCAAVSEMKFPSTDFAKPSFGPFKKPSSDDDPKMCEEPGPKCICTNGIIQQWGFNEGPEPITLGFGIGAALGLFIGGGPVTADLSVSGDTDTQISNKKLTFGTIVEVDDDITSDCVVEGKINFEKCPNSEYPNLKFEGIDKDDQQGITINPSDEDSTRDDITVKLNHFELSLAGFQITADPTIELTGTIAKELSDFTGISFGFAIPFLKFGVADSTGIPIGQHALTGPVKITIPVDYFGVIIPEDIVTEAEGIETLVDIDVPFVNPEVEDDITVTNNLEDVAPAGLFILGSTEITWTAIDDGDPDNVITRTFTQTVTIVDTTPPDITVPDDVGVEAEGTLTNISIGFATATDLVDSSPTFSLSYQIGEELVEEELLVTPGEGFSFELDFPLGETDVEWVATDFEGNEGKGIQTVTVVDTTSPMITAPDDVFEVIEGFEARILFGFAQVVDLVDQNPGITTDKLDAQLAFTCADGTDLEEVTENPQCDDGAEPVKSMLATFPLGTTTVVWTANDEFGNEASAEQQVVAGIIGDDNQNFVQDFLEVDGSPCYEDGVTCKFSFTDEFGNTASGEIIDRGGKVVVVLLPEDSSAITIATGPTEGTGPAKISICDGLATVNLDSNSQVSMFCGSVTITGILGITVIEFNVGDAIITISLPAETTVRYDDFFFNLEYIVAEEVMMNEPVIVVFQGETFVLSEDFPTLNLDTVAPTIVPVSVQRAATDPFGTIIDYELNPTDNLDPNPVVACDPSTGSLFPMGPATTVDCEVTDTSENSSPGSFTVTIFLATETFDGLKQIIGSMGLKQGTEKSLTALIDASTNSFDKGKNKPSINTLNAFKKIVNTQTGKQISEADATTLLDAANLILGQLGGTEPSSLESSSPANSKSEIQGFDENTSVTPDSDTNTDTSEQTKGNESDNSKGTNKSKKQFPSTWFN